MTCELELLMKDWTDEEKSSVYDKVERINSLKSRSKDTVLVSDVINSLQDVLDKHGDLPAIYSKDDEGNDHHKVSWCGSIMYVDDIESYYLDIVENEDEDSDNGLTKVVCIN